MHAVWERDRAPSRCGPGASGGASERGQLTLKGAHRLLERFLGRNVQMVGGLIQHQQRALQVVQQHQAGMERQAGYGTSGDEQCMSKCWAMLTPLVGRAADETRAIGGMTASELPTPWAMHSSPHRLAQRPPTCVSMNLARASRAFSPPLSHSTCEIGQGKAGSEGLAMHASHMHVRHPFMR